LLGCIIRKEIIILILMVIAVSSLLGMVCVCDRLC